MDTIRVIIIDEQPLFERVSERPGAHGQLRHCGESTDPAEVFELARSGTPDVVLIDAGLDVC